MKQTIATDESTGKPFSSAILAGGFVFVSGQGGLDPETGQVVSSDLKTQTLQTLENIQRILQEAHATLADVVKVNVYLKERSHYEEFNQVYGSYFAYPYPARTTIYCDLNFDILVEIDVIALSPKRVDNQ
ncbi:RidA family protein [Paenibacillus aceris]|uniref:2-iminobutanoate/2-iminopropanoate deaminase n=1 Tax=Paenibacillus aceris TaxID=869555 RepID=A0ABS4HZQ2_9BACL|nr:RidA family protein [Paenibacillus aceris]MBP1964137.1 2-iminobutanoate/2-iminopropanoate deaminase [Paenibacillus aceris]NHW36470.1 RidA family protein [Paenibacillus aceris]